MYKFVCLFMIYFIVYQSGQVKGECTLSGVMNLIDCYMDPINELLKMDGTDQEKLEYICGEIPKVKECVNKYPECKDDAQMKQSLESWDEAIKNCETLSGSPPRYTFSVTILLINFILATLFI